MQFFSTQRSSPQVGFREAVINSLPADKGLYFPMAIPRFSYDKISALESAGLPELGFEIMRPYTQDVFSDTTLETIVQEAFNFEIPLVQVEAGIFSLELFHGPTYAFKDVGARFLARCLGEFAKSESRETTILVATSGDTGGAVANGFFNVEGVRVVILYPSGKVSDLQEKQLTTLGGNITALEVEGDFDDCQGLVKQAFLDAELSKKLNLTSANSINIARWMPQSIYYASLALQEKNAAEALIAVPSGNYGNVTAGMLAKRMGFPLGKFLVCSNANDVVPRYLESCEYEVLPTVATYANAMDVSNPSNFPRMLELYDHSFDDLIQEVSGFTLHDEQILETIEQCHKETGYLLDPHGAIGYAGLKKKLKIDQKGVFLETAHPIKFRPVMEKALRDKMPMPGFAKDLMLKQKSSIKMSNEYADFKNLLKQTS
ncbi:threonine synthase [Roseivirga thermotolerans]|nr:threonine synthase [Roseivirga thermotolerans]